MILNDHDRLTAIHAMLDPEGTDDGPVRLERR